MADIFETNPNIPPDQGLDRFLTDFDTRFAKYSTRLRQERESTSRPRSHRVNGAGPVIGAGTLVVVSHALGALSDPELPGNGPVAS